MSTESFPFLSLPSEQALDILLSILDKMDEEILVISRDGSLVYYNQQYIDAYKDIWKKSKHISPEKILTQNIFKLKSNDSKLLSEVIASEKALKKYFVTPDGDSDEHSVFSDVHPIYIEDKLYGIVVIQHQTKQVIELNHQLNYYKSLSKDLKQQLYDKNSLPPRFKNMIGDSAQMLQVLTIGAQVAPTQSSVCLLGESGTGKEVMAEAIHAASSNSSGPLVKVNCAAIPETLIESELFGYEKGAFTGANPGGNIGKFELANNGTLFLDEIGEMPLSMQAKLLRALQEREITRIGGNKTIALNFRLITATNRNLEQMVKDGTFREDFYYRICIIPIHLPPLRSRKSDIPLLANKFLAALNTNPNRTRVFSDDVLEMFTEYNWPGNIRELKNCVERMSVLCPDDVIGCDYLPSQINHEPLPGIDTDGKNRYDLRTITDKAEYDAIKSVLSLAKGNKSKAIQMLGISRRNFYMKLERYGFK